MSEVAAKVSKKTIKIGTHNGTFHCDDSLACFMLTRLPEYKDADIIRTRDVSVLDTCDAVVDVGGIYDPSTHRYDHHQETFKHSMRTLNANAKWTTRLSSAGLVYHHFGRRIIADLTDHRIDSRLIDVIYDRIYENFIEEVDANDNGIDTSDAPRYAITTHLSARVRDLLPPWNKPLLNTEEHFYKLFLEAMALVGKEFTDRVHYYSDVWLPARTLVEDAYKKRFEVDESGEIVSLGAVGMTNCPWNDHLLELEDEDSGTKLTPVKYVLFTDASGLWRIQCVRISKSSYQSRMALPSAWCGLRDDELSKICDIDDCVFVHPSGFVGGNKAYAGVLSMARRALQCGQHD